MSRLHRTAVQVALVSALVWGTAVECAAQQAPGTDGLAMVSQLLGRWTGTTEGQPGTGTVERDYERVLGDRFVRVQNRSTYPPQPKNTKGEVHQDIGFFSYDRSRTSVVFRQFHVEGFVNQYVVDPSGGVRARLTSSKPTGSRRPSNSLAQARSSRCIRGTV